MLTCSVPSRAMRAGHALRAIASPTASGQRSTSSASPGPVSAELPEWRWIWPYRAAYPGSTSTTCAGSSGSAERCVAVIIVCPMPATRSASTSRRPGSSSESTSSSRSSGGARQELGLREQQREHRQPLLALRAVLAQVAVAARDEHVVEVRAEAGRPALEVAGETALQQLDRRRLGVVVQSRAEASPSSSGALRRRPARARQASRAGARRARRRATRPAPSTARARRGRRDRAARGEARRCVARAPRGSPAARRRGRGTGGRARGRSTRGARRGHP